VSEAILSLNAGSSSLKFALYALDGGVPMRVCAGKLEGIGTVPHLIVHDNQGALMVDRGWAEGGNLDHEQLLQDLLLWIEAHLGGCELAAAGHRVVHGGAAFYRPARIDEALLQALDALCPLAPLHQPHNLAAIRAMAAIVPNLPQVACFDTAFHYGRPEVATRLALPRAFHDRGIRRYGFHGLSYEYVARRLREIDPDLASGRVIVAHLGNGASLCAMANGRSIDTSMGFTALDGLMMGTRCGTIDPGVLLHLQMQEGMSAAEVEQMLYNRSGLLGVSGVSSDMRTLHLSDDPAAAEALDLFVWRAVREIGALIAVLGGIDGLIFTAGIGENDPLIRAAICDRLDWAGAQVEASANAANAGSVAAADSRVAIRVIATDEERMIALHTLETLGDRSRAALTPR
jgi:acetate kinase